MSNTSWVIKRRATGEVLFETFNRKVVSAINTEAYEVVEIGKHLASLNGSQPMSWDIKL